MKSLFTTLALSLIVSSTAHAAQSSGRSSQATQARSQSSGRTTMARTTMARSSRVMRTMKAPTPRALQRAWESAFIEEIDGDLTTAYPQQLLIGPMTLTPGSAANRLYRDQVRRFGANLIDIFKDPKNGTIAIRESTDGEGDFRLHVFDAAGTMLLARASVGDDGYARWNFVTSMTSPPVAMPIMTPTRPAQFTPRPVFSREPFRDIGGFAGPARTPAQATPAQTTQARSTANRDFEDDDFFINEPFRDINRRSGGNI